MPQEDSAAHVGVSDLDPSLRRDALADTPVATWDHERRTDPNCPRCGGDGTVVTTKNGNMTITYPCKCAEEYMVWEWLLPVLVLTINVKRMLYKQLAMPEPPTGRPIFLYSQWPEAGKTALIRCMCDWWLTKRAWPTYDIVSGTGSRLGLQWFGQDYLPSHSLWFLDGLQRLPESLGVVTRLVAHEKRVILYSTKLSPEELLRLPGGDILRSAFSTLITPSQDYSGPQVESKIVDVAPLAGGAIPPPVASPMGVGNPKGPTNAK